MTEEAKRNLLTDLAFCNSVFEGCGLCTVAGVEGDDYFRYVVDVGTEGGREPVAYTCDERYARFIAEARVGWPEAIQRALAAGEALRYVLAAIDRGDLRQTRMSSGMDFVVANARRVLNNANNA